MNNASDLPPGVADPTWDSCVVLLVTSDQPSGSTVVNPVAWYGLPAGSVVGVDVDALDAAFDDDEDELHAETPTSAHTADTVADRPKCETVMLTPVALARHDPTTNSART